MTAWIDGSSIYGPSSSWSDSVRSFCGGLLTSGSEWNMPNQASGRTFMWSAADPSTGDHGPQGLYGETFSPTPNSVWCRGKFCCSQGARRSGSHHLEDSMNLLVQTGQLNWVKLKSMELNDRTVHKKNTALQIFLQS